MASTLDDGVHSPSVTWTTSTVGDDYNASDAKYESLSLGSIQRKFSTDTIDTNKYRRQQLFDEFRKSTGIGRKIAKSAVIPAAESSNEIENQRQSNHL